MHIARSALRVGFRASVLWLALGFASADAAKAQGGAFLLVPFGARSVGRGEAVAADSTLGTEGIWWNAASLARMAKRELAFHNVRSIAGNVFMLAGAAPSAKLGTFALGAYLFDYGTFFRTDSAAVTTGTITTRNYLIGASYASPIGKRLSAGLSYKYLVFSQQCSGLCDGVAEVFGSSNALDVGAQYRLPDRLRTTLGLTVRNVGQPLQFKDKEQADRLPRTIQFGVRTRLPLESFAEAGGTLDLSADVIQAEAANAQAAGAVVGYRDQLFLSVGYKQISGEGGGPSIGFTLQQGPFGLDLSRRFDRFSSQLGEAPPTYVALRLRF
ncbi:MAG TPA: PorV/PorQ family protein [Gemmatimonas sp.]|nr:PorV/PorQ family protein [Gemmatimonas sp.]